MIRPQLIVGVRLIVIATVIGLGYSLVTTGLARVLFGDQASGSQVRRGNEVVGSRLVGQQFVRSQFFHPRPSASGYDGRASGAANLGPSNPELIALVAQRVRAYRRENGLGSSVRVPVDAATSSASGLDPHISVANARLQARRVARGRGLPLGRVNELIDRNSERSPLRLGPTVVNVLELNLDVDRLAPP